HGPLRSRGRGGALAAAPDPDDLVRLHLRRGAAGVGDRRRRRAAPDARHRGVLRHDRGHRLRPHLHAGVLRGVPLAGDAVRNAAGGARGARSSGGVAGKVGLHSTMVICMFSTRTVPRTVPRIVLGVLLSTLWTTTSHADEGMWTTNNFP